MRTTATISGQRGVEIAIAQISERLVRGGMRDALMKAARHVTAAAKRNAPRETGALRKSIRQKALTNPKKKLVTVLVGPSRGVTATASDGKLRRPANYAHLVEYGTASRGVWGGRRKKGLFGIGAVKGKTVTPGNPPKPFLRPAWESNKGAVLATYKAEIGNSIRRRAKQLARTKFQPGRRR